MYAKSVICHGGEASKMSDCLMVGARTRSRNPNLIEFVVIAATSLFALVYVLSGGLIGIRLSIGALTAVSVYVAYRFLTRNIGFVLVVLWCVYVLPFVELLSYWDFNFEPPFPSNMWGLASNPYMFEVEIVGLMATMGVVGGLAFACSIATLTCVRRKPPLRSTAREINSLKLPVWLLLPAGAALLAWWSAPSEAIWISDYTESAPPSSGKGFDSAWLVGFALLLLALADSSCDRVRRRRWVKNVIACSVIGIETVFLQLLRGDREILSLVVAVVALLVYWSPSLNRRMSTRSLALVVVPTILALFVVGQILGELRSSLAPSPTNMELASDATAVPTAVSPTPDNPVVHLAARAIHGTWSAVLLTPLSVAGDSIKGDVGFRWGADYRDLFLSLPPGFLAQAFSYDRPVSGNSGPAWRMTYGNGGVHATVVPFANFGLLGIFIVISLWSFALGRLELGALKHPSPRGLFFLGLAVTIAPHWVWYGDKTALTAIVIYLLLVGLYAVLLHSQRALPFGRARNSPTSVASRLS